VFSVHLGKNLYHCGRCGAGGSALDLWSAQSRLPRHAAALDLCERLHPPVPWLPAARPSSPVRDHQPEERPPMPEP
jgi:hypothetical protein